MHILVGFIVALAAITFLLIGWTRGNLFCCVFLSLPPTAYLLIVCLQQPGNNFYPGWVLVCVGLICLAWLPRYGQQRAYHRAYVRLYPPPPVPPKSRRAYDAGQAFAAWTTARVGRAPGSATRY